MVEPKQLEENEYLTEKHSNLSALLVACSPGGSIQNEGIKLKFGTRLEKVSPGQYLNPRLYSLLLYISRCGSIEQGCYLNKISKREKVDKKEIKSLLISGKEFCLSDYSVRSILHILQSFLKHLPRPLLDEDFFEDWISTGKIIYYQSDLPIKKHLVLYNLNVLVGNLGFYENLLLRHLLLSLNLLSTNKNEIISERVHQLSQLFAQCLIRKKHQWNKNKFNRKNIEIAKQSLVSYLIFYVDEVFGAGVKNLFPKQKQDIEKKML